MVVAMIINIKTYSKFEVMYPGLFVYAYVIKYLSCYKRSRLVGGGARHDHGLIRTYGPCPGQWAGPGSSTAGNHRGPNRRLLLF